MIKHLIFIFLNLILFPIAIPVTNQSSFRTAVWRPRLKKYLALQHCYLHPILFLEIRASEFQHCFQRFQYLDPVCLQKVILLDCLFVFIHLHQFEICGSYIRDENTVWKVIFVLFTHFICEVVIYYFYLMVLFNLKWIWIDQDKFVLRE